MKLQVGVFSAEVGICRGKQPVFAVVVIAVFSCEIVLWESGLTLLVDLVVVWVDFFF